MNIAGLQYNLIRKTLEIYVSGCSGPHCDCCHNSEMWDFNVGKDYKLWLNKIKNRLSTGMVEAIWVLGGDPMDQNKEELTDLLNYLKDFNIELWLWTRYAPSDIPENILKTLTYLKSGRYCKDLPKYVDIKTGIELASENQKIYTIEELFS